MSKMFVLLLLGSLQVVHVSTYKLTITPDHMRITNHTTTVNFTCDAPVALSECQFLWWDWDRKAPGPLLEMSQGSESQADPTHLSYYILGNYSYSGRGLEAGDCGISLEMRGTKTWLFACRVRAKGKGWKYAWADLYARDSASLSHTLSAREAVVLPGGEVTFSLDTQEPLYTCFFNLPGVSYQVNFDGGAESANNIGRHRYVGEQLLDGECGLRLTNISEVDNGLVHSNIKNRRWSEEVRLMPLVVACPPTAPTLNLEYTGNVITATCEVPESRPVANISWVLGDVVIQQSDADDSPASNQDEWRWPWMQGSIMQKLTYRLHPEDNGNVLTCRVSHIALATPLEATKVLSDSGITQSTRRPLAISPDHVRLTQDGQTATYSCDADVALAGCQFRWRDYNSVGPILDLSQGPQSRVDPANLGHFFIGYSYSGQGLGAGDCGVSLQVDTPINWFVACRVRAESGGWKYAWADLVSDADKPVPYNITTPREAVVLPGGEVTFSLKAPELLNVCRFFLPGDGARYFDEGAESLQNTGRHRYLGAGLQSGECGLTLTDVNEADNGHVRFDIATPAKKSDSIDMVLIVARRPTAPTLKLTYTATNVKATCEVKKGRPVANITWLLGDDIIRQDSNDDSQASNEDDWRWPWTRGSIMQTLTLQLHPRYQGQTLMCRVDHATLATPLQASELLLFTATCPPLTSGSADFTCYSRGRAVDCNQKHLAGTRAEFSCKPGFNASGDVTSTSIYCLDTGKWEGPTVACTPDCGRPNTNHGQPLISGGTSARVGEFPWHVAIYELKTRGFLDFICGGSLISTSVVISAAHCYWDSQADNKKNSSYRIAAGKLRREWTDVQDSKTVQRREVETITVHSRFHGRTGHWQNDIALLKLKAAVQVTGYVNLVCIDWTNRWQRSHLLPGNNGSVAGWGFTQDGTLSDVLKQVELPSVNFDTCYRALDPILRTGITSDKFCAGYIGQNISTCRGDSGGGFVHLLNATQRFYLMGIVSHNFKPFSNKELCYSQFYTSFTQVSIYTTWLTNHVTGN